MLRRDWLLHTMGATAVLAAGVRPRGLSASRFAPTPLFALRNPGCGCCEGWAEHLRERDFEVHLHESPDLQAVKDRLGVPADLRGCHTGLVEGYIVEGHVPGEFVRRLLDEAPEVAGLAVPGMPMGSPGMEGPTPEAFDVVAFGAAGEMERYVFGSVTPG